MPRKTSESELEGEELTLEEVGRLCLNPADEEGAVLFEKLKRSRRGIRDQVAKLRQIAIDSGILDRGLSDWEFAASRAEVFMEALVGAKDWDDPMEVLGADEHLEGDEDLVPWRFLYSLARARAERGEGDAYAEVADKLYARAEAERKEMESYRATERHVETTLSELVEWCSSRGELGQLQWYLKTSYRKVGELLETEEGEGAQGTGKHGPSPGTPREMKFTFQFDGWEELLKVCRFTTS